MVGVGGEVAGHASIGLGRRVRVRVGVRAGGRVRAGIRAGVRVRGSGACRSRPA